MADGSRGAGAGKRSRGRKAEHRENGIRRSSSNNRYHNNNSNDDSILSAGQLLKSYRLCRHCFARNTVSGAAGSIDREEMSVVTSSPSPSVLKTASKKKKNKGGDSNNNGDCDGGKSSGAAARHCYICRGLMSDLDSIAKEKLLAALAGYEYDTFLVGATLPTQIYEREDAMRARLKIRGKESAKSQLTRELGTRLAKLAGGRKKVDYMRPDVTLNVTIDKDNNVDVAVKARQLVLAGRYAKKSRGLAQKQARCALCQGRGCGSCGSSGLSGSDSVEGIIAKGLMEATGGQAPRISWFGSEDQNSLVLGRGRPFYARIFNPKKRRLPGGLLRIRSKGVFATVSATEPAAGEASGAPEQGEEAAEQPDTQARFSVKTRIHARCAGALESRDLNKLSSLAGATITFEKNRSKMATKKIYSAKVRRLGGGGSANNNNSDFELTIVADGGLAIKQFVGGEEYMKPNVSEILGSRCECINFDILDVSLAY